MPRCMYLYMLYGFVCLFNNAMRLRYLPFSSAEHVTFCEKLAFFCPLGIKYLFQNTQKRNKSIDDCIAKKKTENNPPIGEAVMLTDMQRILNAHKSEGKNEQNQQHVEKYKPNKFH